MGTITHRNCGRRKRKEALDIDTRALERDADNPSVLINAEWPIVALVDQRRPEETPVRP